MGWDGMEIGRVRCVALRCVVLCCGADVLFDESEWHELAAQRAERSGCCEPRDCEPRDSGARAFAELFGRGGRRVDLTVELALALALFLRRHSVRRSVLTSPLLVAVQCRSVLLVRSAGRAAAHGDGRAEGAEQSSAAQRASGGRRRVGFRLRQAAALRDTCP